MFVSLPRLICFFQKSLPDYWPQFSKKSAEIVHHRDLVRNCREKGRVVGEFGMEGHAANAVRAGREVARQPLTVRH